MMSLKCHGDVDLVNVLAWQQMGGWGTWGYDMSLLSSLPAIPVLVVRCSVKLGNT